MPKKKSPLRELSGNVVTITAMPSKEDQKFVRDTIANSVASSYATNKMIGQMPAIGGRPLSKHDQRRYNRNWKFHYTAKRREFLAASKVS